MALSICVYRQLSLSALFFVLFVGFSTEVRYEPNWKSLDSRPLPAWFDEAKVGIFLHWGVFSVPSYGSEWFWYYWKGEKIFNYVDFMKKNYPPEFTYADFAPKFTTEFFDPHAWASLFEKAGAKYIVLTSKHHEGFTNWPSKVSWNWNSMDVGPHRDLVGELAQAVKRTSVRFGLYHSLLEWFNPLYIRDKKNGFSTNEFAQSKAMPELYELVNTYKPEIIWSDGNWESSDDYWGSKPFLTWLYNDSPVKDTVCVNDRWGNNTSCKHGGFLNCHDRFSPGTLQKRKWENAMTIDRNSWGYRRNLHVSDLLTTENIIEELAKTVSCGGNLLVNVGPTHDGRIAPIFEERLLEFGSWLKLNGEAIYGSKPWIYQNDTVTKNVWYTSQKSKNGMTVYAIVLEWPRTSTLHLGALKFSTSLQVSIIGYRGLIKVMQSSEGGIILTTPLIPINEIPTKWAFVLKMIWVPATA